MLASSGRVVTLLTQELSLSRRSRSHLPALHLHRATVEVLHRNGCEVNAFKAANIDSSHGLALVNGLGIRMNAACPAEMVPDEMLVERIRANIFFRGEQAQVFARHEPQERAFARADRAVARHRLGDFTFNLECDLAAVTATLVEHVRAPCALRPAEVQYPAA